MKIKKVEFTPALLPLLYKERYLRRVAAYARVSTESAEQGASLEAQRDYYDQYIKSHSNWRMVDIYYDSGISGLSHKNRDGFNQMISDALDGKIDLIVTKSLSRFARNTVDTLTTIRKLKAAGVEVFFEKENIYTLDSKGEFLITLMSSMAQEESRSISENITWGQRKRFADGRYSVPYRRFLGYDQGGTNSLVVNLDEAKTVKLIFRLFLEGRPEDSIADYLTHNCIPSPSGKPQWSQSVVRNILRNEKYKGDALLQKKFTVDFLQKKIKKNEGELPQYYVEKGHTPILSDELFDLVQAELARRSSLGGRYSFTHPLASKITCSCCGGFYGRKISHSNDSRYRRQFWRCNRFYTKETHAPVINERFLLDSCQAALLYLIDRNSDVATFCADILHDCIPELSSEEWVHKIHSILQMAFGEKYQDGPTWRSVIDHIEISPQRHLRIYFYARSNDPFESPIFSDKLPPPRTNQRNEPAFQLSVGMEPTTEMSSLPSSVSVTTTV